MVEYNTIILGAGASGISCSIYLRRAGLSTLIIENNVPGGQLNKIDTIENYPGYCSISGISLASNLLEQANQYGVDFIYDSVQKIDFDEKIVYVNDKKYTYQYLVFATGRRERTLELQDEEKWIGKGISLCATCDGALYKDQDVIVIGGGNSAVSEAIYLSNICRKVYLIYRKDNLRAEEILRNRLEKKENIEVIYQGIVTEYLINNQKIEGVRLKNGQEIKADCVFFAIGYIPNSELFTGEKRDGYIIVDRFGHTDYRDVYACGDVIEKDVYQLVTASSEGAIVATSIINSYHKK